MKSNLIQQKSFAFAIRIVNTSRYLTLERKEFILSKQLLKSGTSIGANVEEAIGAHSTADFISKLAISYKEARETVYWIKLLKATKYLESAAAESLEKDAEEICRILAKIQLTAKSNIAAKNKNST